MDHYDVIVIGGGTMGSGAAWALGKRGVSALVLEQFDHVHGYGSHGGKTRIIRHAYAEGADYVPLVQRADELWCALEAESGQRILHRTGGIELAAPGYRHARDALESAKAHDLPHEWLTAAEARHRWPQMAVPDDWGALWSPTAGFLLVEPALREMAAAARRLGVVFHEREAVRDWEPDGAGFLVRTDRATYGADRLIVTAGAWAGRLLADLGLPLTVQRKVLWWLAVDDASRFAPDRFPVFITDSAAGEIYGFPILNEPGLKIANHRGGEPTTPETVDRTTRPEERAEVLPIALNLLRGVTDRAVDSAVCLYTRTPDTNFVMDRYPDSLRIVLGAGFSGHGFKFAPAAGEHLVALALDPDARPYPRLALDRFRG